MVAAVVYASDSQPIAWWPVSILWLALLLLLSFLMVSTWRYYSFKGINLSKPYTYLIIVLAGAAIYGIWNYSQIMMLALASAYVASGIITRIGGVVRRRLKHVHPPRTPEHQVG